jgi:hypothetical protein
MTRLIAVPMVKDRTPLAMSAMLSPPFALGVSHTPPNLVKMAKRKRERFYFLWIPAFSFKKKKIVPSPFI